jgi:hypothetical protein
MTLELVATVSRHIVSLVSARDYRLSYDRAAVLLASLTALDVSPLSEKSTSAATQPW